MSGGHDVDVRVDKSLAVPGDGVHVVASCCRERPVMELHLVRGSPGPLFEITAASAGADAVVMDAEAWSKMPEEVMWEVVRFVPAAKLFQLQLVSRKWRHELTSARFRTSRLTEARDQQKQQQEEERVVVACVSPPSSRRPEPRSSGSSTSAVDCEANVLKLDLWFVPSWFWSSFWGWGSYGLVATGHGLVCISNGHELPHETKSAEEAREADRYCVLNPLTRTCIVLPPKLPFQPHSWFLPDSATVAIWSSAPSSDTATACRRLATYYLAAGAGAGAAWVRTHALVTTSCDHSWWSPVGALMAHDKSVGQGRRPTVSRPHPHVRGYVTRGSEHTVVVVHRGALYSAQQLFMASDQAAHATSRQDAVCDVSVWRVADGGERGPEWEEVALLDARSEIERLTGLTCVASVDLRATYAVRQFVCFELECAQLEKRVEWDEEEEVDDNAPQLAAPTVISTTPMFTGAWLLGFNLDTGGWELLASRERFTGDEP